MKDITVRSVKKYILSQVERQEDIDHISSCIKRIQIFNYLKGREDMYHKSLERLYASHNFSLLEYHLSMMNELYDNHHFDKVKKSLFNKLIHQTITFPVFKVLLATHQLPELVLIDLLHQHHHVDALTCARFALYIDEPYEAFQYLRELDECHDDAVLHLLCGFSKSYYIELMAYYKLKKGKVYQLAQA